MSEPSAEQVAQRVFDLGLLDEVQFQQVRAEVTRDMGLDALVQLLVRREFLTNYQVERLLKGERTGFFFGDYKVLYLVGTGSFARVYRAVHRQSGQVVALKVLRRRFSNDPEQYGQFVREGELGCTLRHPNIVPIYEVFSQGTVHFLVMEFVEGRSLREFIKIRKKLDPVEATRLAIDIASGMSYAFERGLTHRDLKLSNVLVSSRGQAKIVDFGLAGVDSSVNEDNLGDLGNARTIDYAALERATGVRKDDPRSDIYFLGCMYYNLLTGKAPLVDTKDRMQRLNKSRFLEIVPIETEAPSLPHFLGSVVNKMMMFDVNRRYQTPAAALTDLRAAAKRLVEDPTGSSEGQRERDRLSAMVAAEDQQAIMIVESNSRMQDVFRDSFKKAGYRVLLTSDPERALLRFQQENRVADCVIFNAQELGEAALTAYNRFVDEQKASLVPAILLLDTNQRGWKKTAKTSPRHVVLAMPLTMKQLQGVLTKLTSQEEAGSEPPTQQTP
ncbi:MAG: protein kinase [Thermoguttaceae bacterium]|jgi:serine/threonine-protein kinase